MRTFLVCLSVGNREDGIRRRHKREQNLLKCKYNLMIIVTSMSLWWSCCYCAGKFEVKSRLWHEWTLYVCITWSWPYVTCYRMTYYILILLVLSITIFSSQHLCSVCVWFGIIYTIMFVLCLLHYMCWHQLDAIRYICNKKTMLVIKYQHITIKRWLCVVYITILRHIFRCFYSCLTYPYIIHLGKIKQCLQELQGINTCFCYCNCNSNHTVYSTIRMISIQYL